MINTYALLNIVLSVALLILGVFMAEVIIKFIINVVRRRDRKKEEEFFQRQYIDNNFKQQRDDLTELRCKVVDNLYRIENLEEKLNEKENKKNVKKKKRN